MKSSKVRFYQNSTLVFCIIFAWVRFTVLFLTDVRWGRDFLTYKKSLAEVSLKKWSSAWKLACKFKSKLWKVNYFYIMYLFGPKWAPKYVLDQKCVHLPYARHYSPLLIWNCSWILTIHKARILRKKPLEKTFLEFKKWVKSIQTMGYNGARTVCKMQVKK